MGRSKAVYSVTKNLYSSIHDFLLVTKPLNQYIENSVNKPLYNLQGSNKDFRFKGQFIRSPDPFYLVSYYMKWAKTSWTYSRKGGCQHFSKIFFLGSLHLTYRGRNKNRAETFIFFLLHFYLWSILSVYCNPPYNF